MRRNAFIMCLIVLAVNSVYSQKYATRTGNIKFEASVPSFEEVAAENKAVSAALNTANGEIAVLALMKGFRFKIALMEEHFNESYAETDKHPKATFTGKIEGLDVNTLTTSGKSYTITGDLTLHGKTKRITDTATVSKSGNNINITGKFTVRPQDFAIEVPKVVSKKVAEQVNVEYNLTLSK